MDSFLTSGTMSTGKDRTTRGGELRPSHGHRWLVVKSENKIAVFERRCTRKIHSPYIVFAVELQYLSTTICHDGHPHNRFIRHFINAPLNLPACLYSSLALCVLSLISAAVCVKKSGQQARY